MLWTSNYRCTSDVGKALKNLQLLSAISDSDSRFCRKKIHFVVPSPLPKCILSTTEHAKLSICIYYYTIVSIIILLIIYLLLSICLYNTNSNGLLKDLVGHEIKKSKSAGVI